jgi:alanyl-tRNA synthetase
VVQRAKWEAAVRLGRSWSADITVQGWRDGAGKLWQPNTLAQVDDDFLAMHSELLISAVRNTLDEQGTLTELGQRNIDTGMGAERTELFLNGRETVWETPEMGALLDAVASGLGVATGRLDEDGIRAQRIVADHIRAGLTIAAAGVYPSASRQGYVLRRLVRRSVRQAQLLTGSDDGLTETIHTLTGVIAEVQGTRWKDLTGESGEHAREVVDKEVAKFGKALEHGLEELHLQAEEGKTFDGDVAFHAADTLGYPAELALEEATRIGMAVDAGWQERYEELREEQRARSRG